MSLWPWRRKREHPELDELQMAKAKLAVGNALIASERRAAEAARRRLDAAVARQQDEIRRNHLGELMHDALVVRRRQT